MTFSADIWFYLLIPVMAFLYASVGHGGASGYLALMALYGFLPDTMRSTALILNILVSAISFLQFYRQGHFLMHLFKPLAIASVPAAFLGGLVKPEPEIYHRILGLILLIPVVRLAGLFPIKQKTLQPENKTLLYLFGALIGFASGVLGIGGGIVLSPLILLLHWANMKQTAALSALFILVNSIAGLVGLFARGLAVHHEMLPLILLALGGGFAGAYLGARKMQSDLLKKILALVLLVASFKLIAS